MESVTLFLLRQVPFGDKVKQDSQCIYDYVLSFLTQRLIPVPYLHNNNTIDEIGIKDGDSITTIISKVETTKSALLDERSIQRNHKKGRITRFLDAVLQSEHIYVYIPIPKSTNGFIGKVKRSSVVVATSTHYGICPESFKLVPGGGNDRVVCVEIDAFIETSAATRIKLPPASIQKLSAEIAEHVGIRRLCTK